MPRTGWGKKKKEGLPESNDWFDPLCRKLGIPVYADYETKKEYEKALKAKRVQ